MQQVRSRQGDAENYRRGQDQAHEDQAVGYIPRMTTSAGELAKIVFELGEGAPAHTESLWAQPLGSNLYRLDNTPWFARDCALGDVVRCEESTGQPPRFLEVVEASGNLTVRVFVPETPERAMTMSELRANLERLGCVGEGMGVDKGLIAVTIPKSTARADVISMLDQLEARQAAFWEAGNF